MRFSSLIFKSFLAAAAMFSFRPAFSADLPFVPVEGYFFKNNNPLPKPVNYFVMDTQEQTERFFHIGRTMGTPQFLDFSKRSIAIVLPVTSFQTDVSVVSVLQDTGTNRLTVKYKVDRGGEMSYQIIPMVLFQIEKTPVSEIAFTQDGVFFEFVRGLSYPDKDPKVK